MAGKIDIFQNEMKAFEETGPEMEIPGRDLDDGGNVPGKKRKKQADNRPAV